MDEHRPAQPDNPDRKLLTAVTGLAVAFGLVLLLVVAAVVLLVWWLLG